MKKLTLKFREIYKDYDYEDHNFDILMKLMDIVLEMMKIANIEDADNIKRLASFIKVLSSDFCLDVMNAEIIDEIYANQVLPIFVEFDNKYEDEVCTVKDTPEHTVRIYKNKIIPVIKNVKNKVISIVKRRSDTSMCDSYESDEKFFRDDTYDDKVTIRPDEILFDVLQSTNDRLMTIYYNIKKKKGNDKTVLRELQEIESSSKLSEVHENESIKRMSSALSVISNFLINVVDDNDVVLLYKREQDIEESFRYIRKLKYSA